jgi:hypothetical protein
MKVLDRIRARTGGELLDDLVAYASNWLEEHEGDVDLDELRRAIVFRLGETGVATLHHGVNCEIARGYGTRCTRQGCGWSWPRSGLS